MQGFTLIARCVDALIADGGDLTISSSQAQVIISGGAEPVFVHRSSEAFVVITIHKHSISSCQICVDDNSPVVFPCMPGLISRISVGVKRVSLVNQSLGVLEQPIFSCGVFLYCHVTDMSIHRSCLKFLNIRHHEPLLLHVDGSMDSTQRLLDHDLSSADCHPSEWQRMPSPSTLPRRMICNDMGGSHQHCWIGAPGGLVALMPSNTGRTINFAASHDSWWWLWSDSIIAFSHQRFTPPPQQLRLQAHSQGKRCLATLICEGDSGACDTRSFLLQHHRTSRQTVTCDNCDRQLLAPRHRWRFRLARQLAFYLISHGIDGILLNIEHDLECPNQLKSMQQRMDQLYDLDAVVTHEESSDQLQLMLNFCQDLRYEIEIEFHRWQCRHSRHHNQHRRPKPIVVWYDAVDQRHGRIHWKSSVRGNEMWLSP